MDAGLSFEVVWSDIDVVEMRVIAANADFRARVDLYATDEVTADAALASSGFPRGIGDVRVVRWGAFGREWAGGVAELRFTCVATVGRSFVEARLEADEPVGGVLQQARVVVGIDAAGVDDFVRQLRGIASNREGRAFLPMSH